MTTAALYLRDQDGDGFDLVGSIGAAVAKRIESLGARPVLDRLEKELRDGERWSSFDRALGGGACFGGHEPIEEQQRLIRVLLAVTRGPRERRTPNDFVTQLRTRLFPQIRRERSRADHPQELHS